MQRQFSLISLVLIGLHVANGDNCSPDELECRIDKQCYPKENRCNGIEDCHDGEDEYECDACNGGAVPCRRSSYVKCLPSETRCDGIMACQGAPDEENCTVCNKNAFKCPKEERCIQEKWVCDGRADCNDFADEIGCFECGADELFCPFDSVECIHASKILDGNNDCGGCYDERFSEECFNDEVPTEIKLMTDKRSVELYLKLLESGSEKKRDIRLVVVGKKGAGKTSLIKRLFGEDITDVTSTNGIEIHKIKCKAKSDDGIWNKLDGNHEETEPQARLLKEYEGKLQDKGTVEKPIESHIAINDNTPSTSFDVTKKSKTVYQLPEIMKSQKSADPPLTNQHPDQSLEQAGRDFEAMQTAKSKVDLTDKEEYATLLLWDFAGDEEFYHTHQTFLSPDAIYLVVTKLNEADDPKARDLFRLWIDSIHCYCRLEQDKNEADDNKFPNCIDPPVVVIGTWKDAVTCGIEELENACHENLWQYTENLSEDERGHIRSKYFISNKKDDNHVFLQIRQDILNLARSMRTWNTDYPLKFIQLEQ
ncbi:unnamed protein product [Mytilus edulis]|uniref:Uncharacterized protein n=1 Tax=Mytilus edulis TaxID=6550 RepID=A0A8S3VDZ2_MYTED|nr:unnamed protein product [Mytilus edulis]